LPGIVHDEQIIVDAMTLDPYDLPNFNSEEYLLKKEEYFNNKKEGDVDFHLGFEMPMAIQYYYRNEAIKEYYKTIKDLFKFMQVNPNVNYRYLFIPQESLMPNYDILEFGVKYTANAMKWG